MTEAEQLLERAVRAIEGIEASLKIIANCIDMASDQPEEDDGLEPVAFNIRKVD
jgi:hypothetical protein